MKTLKIAPLFVTIILVIIACSNDTISPTFRPNDLPVMDISGTAVDGLIRLGKIEAYNVNEDCSPADKIGESMTDSKGKFSIGLKHKPNEEKLVLFKISSGYYYEEANQIRVDIAPSQALYGLDRIKFKNNAEIKRTVSGFSHAMYKLACYISNNEEKTINQSYGEASLQISLMIGGFDPMTTDYIDVFSSESIGIDFDSEANANALFYSYMVGGISYMIDGINKEQGAAFRSINFFIALGDDLRNDGIINGTGYDGKIGIGTTRLYPNLIRTVAMRHVETMYLNPEKTRVKKRIKESEKMRFEGRLRNAHNSVVDIYNNKPVEALDNVPPVVTSDLTNRLLNGNTINFTFNEKLKHLKIDVYDSLGAIVQTKEVTQKLDAGYSLILNDGSAKTGQYQITIAAKDLGDNISTFTKSFTRVLDAPRITFSDFPKIVTQSFTITGNYELIDPDVDLRSIEAQWLGELKENELFIWERDPKSKSFSININVPEFLHGVHGLNINICDVFNNCYSVVNSIKIDKNAPLVSDVSFNNSVKTYKIENDRLSITDNVLNIDHFTNNRNNYGFYVDNNKQSLGSIAATIGSLNQSSIPYFAFRVKDNPIDLDAKTPNNELTAKVVYSLTSIDDFTKQVVKSKVKETTSTLMSYFTNRNDGTKQFVLPLTTEYLGDNFFSQDSTKIHVLDVYICDHAKNCTDQSFYFMYYLDNKLPVIANDLPSTGTPIKNHSVNVSSDEPLTSLVISVFNSDGNRVETKTHKNVSTSVVFAITRNLYATGDYRLNIVATDRGANMVESNSTFTMLFDAPTLSFSDMPTTVSDDFVVNGKFALQHNSIHIKSIKASFVGQNAQYVATIKDQSFKIEINTPAAGGDHQLVTTVCDELDNCRSYTNSITIDKNAPILSYKQYNDNITVYTVGSSALQLQQKGSSISYFLNSLSRGFLVSNGKQSLGSVELSLSSLKANGIPFYAFRVKDNGADGNAKTPNDELIAKIVYSVAKTSLDEPIKNKISETTSTLLTYANLADGTKQFILPLTTEILGNNFYARSSTNIEHIVDISICDKANNCANTSFYFLYRIIIEQSGVATIEPTRIDYTSDISKRVFWNGEYKVQKYTYTNTNLLPVYLYFKPKHTTTLNRDYHKRITKAVKHTCRSVRSTGKNGGGSKTYGTPYTQYTACPSDGGNHYVSVSYTAKRCVLYCGSTDEEVYEYYTAYRTEFSHWTGTETVSREEVPVTSAILAIKDAVYKYIDSIPQDTYNNSIGAFTAVSNLHGELDPDLINDFYRIKIATNERVTINVNSTFPSFAIHDDINAIADPKVPSISTLKLDKSLSYSTTLNFEYYLSLDDIKPSPINKHSLTKTFSVSR